MGPINKSARVVGVYGVPQASPGSPVRPVGAVVSTTQHQDDVTRAYAWLQSLVNRSSTTKALSTGQELEPAAIAPRARYDVMKRDAVSRAAGEAYARLATPRSMAVERESEESSPGRFFPPALRA